MKYKTLKEATERLAGRLCIYLSSIIVKALPEAILYRFSQIIGSVVFYSASKRRSRTIENLSFVFKNEKSPQEIKSMARQVFHELAQNVADTAIFLLRSVSLDERLRERISVEGAQYSDDALKDNKGAICVTAHLGNLMMITPRLSLMGYPCNMIANLTDSPLVAEMWGTMMKDAGIRWIPAQLRIKSVSESMRWLKSGGVLFLHADRNQNDGVYVKFFNRSAGTVEGPALLHLRTGAPLLCAFIVRLTGRNHQITITPPIRVTGTGNRDEAVYEITQAFIRKTEDFAKRYPEQVWWFRKRWKRNK